MSKELVSTLNPNAIPYKINPDWTWYKWGDIIESYQQGLIRSNSELNSENGVDYFKMNFINTDGSYTFNGLPKTYASENEIESYKLKSGDYLINVRNSKELVGKSCVIYGIGKDILFNHMLVRIKHKQYITGSYINAYFNTDFGRKLLDTCKKGTTTVIALYQRDLYELPIPIPSEHVLKQIDSIYNSINRKIELNNRINAELEAMAKTVYDYWFVQFDFPFDFAQGKPNASGKPYKSSGGKMVWSEELKREVPEGWEVSLIADWILKDKNGDWGKESLEGNYTEHVSCIRGADINGLNGKGECNPPERYILEKNSNKQLNSHDLIVEISGGSPTQSTGRLAYLIDETLNRFDNPLICSNFCKAIELKNKKQLFNFVYNWNRLYDNGVLFGYEGKTSGIKNLLFDSFVNSYWVAVPPQELVSKFYDLMLDVEKKKQTALKENQQLSTLRDWLLPMLMNGQVKVGGEATLSKSGSDKYMSKGKEMGGLMVAESEEGYGV